MLVVGLTGGIGSGKSSVSERLVNKGALLIDADVIVRELQEPGAAVFEAMVARFGPKIVGSDGKLDRQAVAELVFSDKEALADLNNIVHPAVGLEMAARIEKVKGTETIVVMDIPLLTEKRPEMSQVIVVDTPVEVAIERLVKHRGFTEADARARIENQISPEERLAIADFVVNNAQGLEELDTEVERLWAWLQSLEQTPETLEQPPGG